MSRDQLIGLGIFGASIALVAIYAWLVFLTEYALLILKLTCFMITLIVFSILAWIGYTLMKTPPPKPVEDIEKEIEKELKKLDSEIEERG